MDILPDYKELKKLSKNEIKNDTKTVKLALLSDSSTQLFAISLQGMANYLNLKLEIHEVGYNQNEINIIDAGSDLYNFKPDFIIIHYCDKKMAENFHQLKFEDRSYFAKNKIKTIADNIDRIRDHSNAIIILNNYSIPMDRVFGSYSLNLKSSFSYQMIELNSFLINFVSNNQNVLINNLVGLQNFNLNKNFNDNRLFYNLKNCYSFEALPVVAKSYLDLILAARGILKKCLILDLDNTIWGGIIGDDGYENLKIGDSGVGRVFSEIQSWAKSLKERGIILAICSKNSEDVAKIPFLKHPDMVLSLDDISIFIANWESKAENIRTIQSVLNIGFDSMVFVDDNPFERDLVRSELPELCVPELPEDPCQYLDYLTRLNLFETTAVSTEDKSRTLMYQVEAKRIEEGKTFKTVDDFLNQLKMECVVEGFNSFNIPRVSQLTQRSNQFNLRTIRYSEAEITKFSESDEYANFTFSLTDKYGEYGLVSVIILKKINNELLFIDTWVMSCRVLKRTLENFIVNTLIEYAQKNNFKLLSGEFIPTPKNKLVENLYSELGFQEVKGNWNLNPQSEKLRKTFINIKD